MSSLLLHLPTPGNLWSSSSAVRLRFVLGRWHSHSTRQSIRATGSAEALVTSTHLPTLQNSLSSRPSFSGGHLLIKPWFRSASSSSSTFSASSPRTPPPSTARNVAASPSTPSSAAEQTSTPTTPTTDNIFKTGLADTPLGLDVENGGGSISEKVDWSRSFHGISAERFPTEAADILLAPVDPEEVEVKPDGIAYLPEIKYRRILNKAFGPGGWGLVPRSESIVTPKTVTREYALICNGRLVSIARGEQDYFSPDGIPTATEGCRSNALVRCCKDLGIASELWDPRWLRKFKASYTREAFVEHLVNKRKSKIWIRKDDQVVYPWKETK